MSPFFFLEWVGYWLAWGGFHDPELTVFYFRLVAKCSALSYKTPLGTERNGSERKTPLARWRNTRYLYFYYSSFITMWRGWASGRLLFLSKFAIDSMRWSARVWMLYLLLNRLILLVLSLLLLSSFLHFVHFTPLLHFLSTCTHVPAYFVVTSRHVPSFTTSTEIDMQLFEPGEEPFQYMTPDNSVV